MDTAPVVERFSGFADCYDEARPTPPESLVTMLLSYIELPHYLPKLVVDLGCGTGLSTRIWAARAYDVVGIEPSDDMRRRAEEATNGAWGYGNVRYQAGTSYATGLPDASADVVTCSQSFHWMEPQATLAETARILRPGGIFAAYDCDWPPVMGWQAELAYCEFQEHARELEQQHGILDEVPRWPKEGHLESIRKSGHFRYHREIVFYNTESGTEERLLELARSQGGVASLLKRGFTEEQVGLERLRKAIAGAFSEMGATWYFCYRLRMGIR